MLKILKTQNQALQLAKYAKKFMKEGTPSPNVYHKTKFFHYDAAVCGISALNYKTNAPTLLRQEAIQLTSASKTKAASAKVFGHKGWVPSTLAITANCSAVRQWDSNGTVFGYSKGDSQRQAGQFGHNDFYPVVMAAANLNSGIDGKTALKAMVLLDQIRGRLCQVFSLKTYKIDHVVHGAIASICTYGALLQATDQQIESAIGMFVAHYMPFRAIRAGKQISDSKGTSAAFSTQAAIKCLNRAMNGFIGPKDIFNNPEAIFRLFTKSKECPFDLNLSMSGQDFAVMGMHFKLGLYQHQSAGAIQAVRDLIHQKKLGGFKIQDLKSVQIVAYEPAFGIIGGEEKKNPTTRQSADHSMAFIVASVLRKASMNKQLNQSKSAQQTWMDLMLVPQDFGYKGLFQSKTRAIMSKINFSHGGKQYDSKYPEGIPTSVKINIGGQLLDSGMVLFPSGHSRNTKTDMYKILNHKFNLLLRKGLVQDQKVKLLDQLSKFQNLNNSELNALFDIELKPSEFSIDDQKFNW